MFFSSVISAESAGLGCGVIHAEARLQRCVARGTNLPRKGSFQGSDAH